MKKTLSIAELDSQTAFELPNRDLMALVNVVLVDTLNNLTIQVPIGVAANLCDINAAVLAAQVVDTGTATCDADNDTIASRGPGRNA